MAQQQVQQPATADTSAGVAQSPMQPNASPFVPGDSGSGAACAQAGHLQHALAKCFHMHQQQQQHLWQQQQHLWQLSVRLTQQLWDMWQRMQMQMHVQVCCSMDGGERSELPVVTGGSRSRQ